MKIGFTCFALVVLCGFVGSAQAGTRTCPKVDEIEQVVKTDQVSFVSKDRQWEGSDPSISQVVTNVKFEAANILPHEKNKQGGVDMTPVRCDYTGSGNGIQLAHYGWDVRPSGAYWPGSAPPYRCESDDPGKCPFTEEN